MADAVEMITCLKTTYFEILLGERENFFRGVESTVNCSNSSMNIVVLLD